MERCPFCGNEYARLEALARHLVESHRLVVLNHHGTARVFRVERHRALRVYCVCGETFSCLGQAQPLFPGEPAPREENGFLAHLRRVGGMAKHLARLEDLALLATIAGEETS